MPPVAERREPAQCDLRAVGRSNYISGRLAVCAGVDERCAWRNRCPLWDRGGAEVDTERADVLLASPSNGSHLGRPVAGRRPVLLANSSPLVVASRADAIRNALERLAVFGRTKLVARPSVVVSLSRRHDCCELLFAY
ncbi:hypothetical protein MTO96_009965 [Rhipicephalus appendiculatus]